MKNTINFFDNADEAANQEIMNFDGEFDGMNQETYNYQADGAMDMSKTSKPYIVKITNTLTVAVTDQVILDAGKQYQNSGSNYGLITGVTPSYEVPGIDYDQFLADLLTTAAFIGQMYIESGTQSNLTAPMTIETYDVLGGSESHMIDNVIDPYQNQTSAIISVKRFAWNKFTKLTLSSIAASSYVTFRFYPVAKNLAQATQEFAKPIIARPAARQLGM